MKNKSAKSRKRGWRKIDVSEVEDFIADQRLQERTGGIVADKTNDELFILDGANVTTPPEKSSEKLSKETRQLKCYSNLEPDPRIPAVTKYVKGNTKILKQIQDKPISKKLSKSLEQRKIALQLKAARKAKTTKIHQEAYDLWDSPTSNYDVDEHYATVTKRRRVNLPGTYRVKPSAVPPVEPPHPGSSYNPAFDDHQKLLHSAITRQVKDDVAEKKIERKLKPDFSQTAPPTKASVLREMSEGLGGIDDADSNDDSNNEESSEEQDTLTSKAGVSIKIKTKTQRNKQNSYKQKQREKLKDKEQKKWKERNRTDKINTILKEVMKEEKQHDKILALREKKRQLLPTRTQRLNKEKFEEPEIDVLLTDELSGSLRKTPTSNSLLVDRFKSLQKRNIIEPRKRAEPQRQYKPKYAEKKGFKEITATSHAGGGIIIPYTKKRHDE